MEQWEIEEKYQELLHDFYFERLKFCGCGRPDFTLEFIKKFLNVIQERTDEYDKPDYNHRKVWDKYHEKLKEVFEFKNHEDNELSEVQDGIVQFVMYHLDNIGILEHGSGISGAWLTKYGIQILEALNYFDDLDIF